MKLKSVIIFTISLTLHLNSVSGQSVPNRFNKQKDLFIAQFDSIPDPDDIHSQAAVGSLLAHPDFAGVNYIGVAGAYGEQIINNGKGFIDSTPLFNLAFGPEALPNNSPKERAAARWVNAHGGNQNYTKNSKGLYVRPEQRVQKLDFATDFIAERAKAVLQQEGRVFIMEAGQSDLTAEWVEKLIRQGVTNTGSNIFLVQHSSYNEEHTPGHPSKPVLFDDGKNDWEFINNPKNLTYCIIDDGNTVYGTDDAPRRDRSNQQTPNFKNDDNSKLLVQAKSANNPNDHTKKLWILASQIIDKHLKTQPNKKWKHFRKGFVDFSDTVEMMWIFDLAHESKKLTTAEDFWKSFVINTPVTKN